MTKIAFKRQGDSTMLKHILMVIIMATALFTGAAGNVLAMIGEPDVVYYGTALTAASGNSVVITLDGIAAKPISYSVGADLKYVLRVPMDSVGARLLNTARTGDAATITINGVLAAKVVIPARGTLVKMDLSKRDAEQWAKDHPGDSGAGDMNRNGISDLTEYLSGKDPAGCVWMAADAVHAETTVYHQQVLKNCLADAGSDLKHNLIKVAKGNYAGNFNYSAASGEDYNLTLIGGYDPAGVAERLADPVITVLNGDTDADGVGNGITLAVDTDSGKTSGTIRIESLAIKNGKAPAAQKGGGLQARLHNGALELVGNIFSGNSAAIGGGLSVDSGDSAPVFLVNNIFYGNSAATAAAVRIAAVTGAVTLLNNTIADNTAGAAGDGRSLLIETTTAAVDLTNNIVVGVAGVSGSEIYINSSGVNIQLVVAHNGYDAATGLLVTAPAFTPDGSAVTGAPLFKAPSAGNYRLGALSPCIDNGIAHPKLTDKDIVGASRVSGSIDLGAFEINKVAATVALGNLAQTYDGAARVATATTDPAGKNVVFIYDGSTTAPTNIGSYAVVATINDVEYSGSASGTLVIGKATAAVILGSLSATYDGNAKSTIATTIPAGKTVSITYGGSVTQPINAGSYVVVGTISDSNYQGSAGGNLVIGKAPQAITLAATASKTYGNANFGLGATVPSGLQLAYASDKLSVATVAADGLIHIVGAGEAIITVSQAGDGNYNAASAQQTITVSKAVITATAVNASRAYGTAEPVFTATYSGFVNGENATVITGTPAFTTDALISSPVGSYSITPVVTGLSAANYNFTAAPGTLAVGIASQSITFNPLANKTYGAGSFALSATGGASGNPVTYSSSDLNVATISGTNVTITGAGTTTITADQAGTNGAYATATAQQSLTVSKATITVTADNHSRAYNVANPPLTYVYSGFVNGDTVSVISGAPLLATTAVQASPVGSYPVTATISTLTATNYNFTAVSGTLAVGLANQSITFDPLAAKNYGDTAFDLNANGGGSGNTVIFASSNPAVATVSGTTVTIIGAGNAIITASQAGNSNYASATAQQTLTVSKAPLTVAAQNAGRVYGAANPTFIAGYSGFVNNDSDTLLQGAPTFATTADSASAPGSYPITATVGNLFSNNYSFSYANGTLTIGKATATIALGNMNQVYDAGAKSATVTTTPNGLVIGVTYDGSTTAPTNIGSYAVVATINDVEYSGSASGTLIIGYSSTGPSIILSSLADNAVTSLPTINVSGTVTAINGRKTLTVNGKLVTVDNSGFFSAPVLLSHGSNSIILVATDNADLKTTVSRTITLDATAPLISLDRDQADNSVTNTSRITVSGSVDRAGTTVTISVNGGVPQPATMAGSGFSLPVDLTLGLNTIIITATDSDGKSASIKQSITLSSSMALAVTSPSHDLKSGTLDLTISGTVTGGTAPLTITVTMDGQSFFPAITNGNFNQALTFAAEKSYPITVTATDSNGNSVTVTRTVIYAWLGNSNGSGSATLVDTLRAYRIALKLDSGTATDLLRYDVAPLDSDGKPQGDGVIGLGDVILLLRNSIGLLNW